MEVYDYEEDCMPGEIEIPFDKKYHMPKFFGVAVKAKRCGKCNCIKFVNCSNNKFICKSCRWGLVWQSYYAKTCCLQGLPLHVLRTKLRHVIILSRSVILKSSLFVAKDKVT